MTIIKNALQLLLLLIFLFPIFLCICASLVIELYLLHSIAHKLGWWRFCGGHSLMEQSEKNSGIYIVNTD